MVKWTGLSGNPGGNPGTKKAKKKQGKKQRKHGRSKIWCQAYFNRGQRLKNKKAKLKKHLIHHVNDKVASDRLSKNN